MNFPKIIGKRSGNRYPQGKPYAYEGPVEFRNFKHSIALNNLVTNLMKKRKFPFKSTHLKPKIRIIHYF